MGSMVARWLASQEGSTPPSGPGPFLVSAWVLCRIPPTVQRHTVSGVMLTAESKLPIAVSVNGFLSVCLSVCVSPATDCRPVQGAPPPLALW